MTLDEYKQRLQIFEKKKRCRVRLFVSVCQYLLGLDTLHSKRSEFQKHSFRK